MSADDIRAGGAFVEIYAEDDDFVSTISRDAAVMEDFAQTMVNVGRGLAEAGQQLAIAGGLLAAPLFAAVRVGSAAEEIAAKFDTVFGEMAESTNEWADSFAMNLGRSEKDIKGFLSTFQDTFVPLGFAREDAAALSMQMTTLATDLSSFNNISMDQATQRITSFLVGNHEAARAFGVVVNQAALDEQLLAMGFQKVSKGASEQQKVMARLALIMKMTGDAQGDAARTSGSFANVTRRLEADIDNLANTVGTILLPAWTELTRGASRAIKWVDDFVKTNPQVVENIDKMASGLILLGGSMYGLGKATEAVSILFSPTGMFAAGVAGLLYMSGALDETIDTWGDFVGNIQVGSRNIAEWFEIAGTVAGTAFDLGVLHAEQALDQLILYLEDTFLIEAMTVFRDVGDFAVSAFQTLATKITEAMTPVLNYLIDTLNSIIESVNWVISKANTVTMMTGGTTNDLVGKMDTIERIDEQAASGAATQVGIGAKDAFYDLFHATLNAASEDFMSRGKRAVEREGEIAEMSDRLSTALQPITDGISNAIGEFNVEEVKTGVDLSKIQPAGPDEVKQKIDTIGTFSAKAAGLLGGSERISQGERLQINLSKQQLDALAEQTELLASMSLGYAGGN